MNFNNSISIKKAQSQRRLRTFSVEHFGKLGCFDELHYCNFTHIQVALMISLSPT